MNIKKKRLTIVCGTWKNVKTVSFLQDYIAENKKQEFREKLEEERENIFRRLKRLDFVLLAQQLQWKFKFFFAFSRFVAVSKATGDLFLFSPFTIFAKNVSERFAHISFFSSRSSTTSWLKKPEKKSLELSRTDRHKMCMKKFVLQESQTGVRRGKKKL